MAMSIKSPLAHHRVASAIGAATPSPLAWADAQARVQSQSYAMTQYERSFECSRSSSFVRSTRSVIHMFVHLWSSICHPG
eukprot:2207930-Amphidinium_carterae.1